MTQYRSGPHRGRYRGAVLVLPYRKEYQYRLAPAVLSTAAVPASTEYREGAGGRVEAPVMPARIASAEFSEPRARDLKTPDPSTAGTASNPCGVGVLGSGPSAGVLDPWSSAPHLSIPATPGTSPAPLERLHAPLHTGGDIAPIPTRSISRTDSTNTTFMSTRRSTR